MRPHQVGLVAVRRLALEEQPSALADRAPTASRARSAAGRVDGPAAGHRRVRTCRRQLSGRRGQYAVVDEPADLRRQFGGFGVVPVPQQADAWPAGPRRCRRPRATASRGSSRARGPGAAPRARRPDTCRRTCRRSPPSRPARRRAPRRCRRPPARWSAPPAGRSAPASSWRDIPTPRCSTMMTSSPSAAARLRSPRYSATDAAPGPPGMITTGCADLRPART